MKHPILLLVLCVTGALAQAAKVELDPSHWGHPEGENCVSCHAKASPGLAEQWRESAHQRAGVNCLDCHQADSADVDAITHEGQVIATIVSPKDCGRCHQQEFEEQAGSVHAEAHAIISERVPALAHNLTGAAMQAAGCDQCHGSRVKVRGDGSLDPTTWPNSGIGRINPDGSKGSCSSCHGRHAFSKAQAREPDACVRCHSGPDSPDKEVFEASKHGMIYKANREAMNLDADTWIAGQDYKAAPTCVTCHMGGAGKIPSTHDVGLRNAWSLNTPVSARQYLVVLESGEKLELPADQKPPKRGSELTKADGGTGKVKMVVGPDRRRQIMSMVCLECHGKTFTASFMDQFDAVVQLYNGKFGEPAAAIMKGLYEQGLLTPLPFDEPLEFIYWELWHDEGARARHGAAMMSPNHAWWEGMYLVGRNFYSRFLPEARAVAGGAAAELVDSVLARSDHHRWQSSPDAANPILGWSPPPRLEPDTSELEESADPSGQSPRAGAEAQAVAPMTEAVPVSPASEGRGDD
ncbi:Hydroxylamine oxidoreductase precursor [Thiorhodovibrio winogradskyi]|uniref:Hydroxylamine oxidoreductase n=1 Tax=Thiorhodovibrio winogradskyi TaxID=77007 RepID=A0ABZ0SFM0_9GAMM|nr:multiheme c-type cytochrome [Thiorhodovibrio winogradskyi]